MEIPLFPLNTVLFPGARLPLNIFEDRYKLMLKQCLEGPSQFGVVLISKGNEVGGAAEPYEVGTTARILAVEETEDGRYLIEVEGETRFLIEEQLHRYPYIRARVVPLPYEGREVTGGPAVVLSRGEVIVDHGTLKAKPGRGQFVKRQGGRPLVP